MLNQPIAVLGGGNQGHTIAADLALSGYEVHFYDHPRFRKTFKATLEKGAIEILDQVTGAKTVAKVHKVTTDIKEAINGVQLILMTLPSFGQDLFFNTLIPHLKDGQVVVLTPGNFGSLRLHKLLREQGAKDKVTVCETSTTPFHARLIAPATVSVFVTGHRFGPTWLGVKAPKGPPLYPHVIAALPSKNTKVAVEPFLKLYPFYSTTKNVLVSAFSSWNFVGQPGTTVCNAGRIEYANLVLKCDYHQYHEGQTPSVRRVITGLRDETAALVRAIGGKVLLTREVTKHYLDARFAVAVPVGPRALKERYLSENVPYGLVPMSEFGEKLGVATPLINSIIEIASVLNKEDYRKTGRTLETLGLDRLNKEQIMNLVGRGVLLEQK